MRLEPAKVAGECIFQMLPDAVVNVDTIKALTGVTPAGGIAQSRGVGPRTAQESP